MLSNTFVYSSPSSLNGQLLFLRYWSRPAIVISSI